MSVQFVFEEACDIFDVQKINIHNQHQSLAEYQRRIFEPVSEYNEAIIYSYVTLDSLLIVNCVL